jgi:hypothetical protein
MLPPPPSALYTTEWNIGLGYIAAVMTRTPKTAVFHFIEIVTKCVSACL